MKTSDSPLAAFCINDIYGGSYLTDFVAFTMEDGDIMYEEY